MAKRFENPLLSDARLREMYASMLEARAFAGRMGRGRSGQLERGMEACWVGSAIGLRDQKEQAKDFASAGGGGSMLDLALGLKLRAALRGDGAPGRLQGSELKTSERVWFALGAASRMMGEKAAGLIYVSNSDLSAAEWKLALSESQTMQLPVVFVAIPGRRDDAGIAAFADKCGVPGIPVDASDAVAMYRVTQESLGRARAGGGPALIEAVRFPAPADPIQLLRKQLVAKRVVTERWAATLEQKIAARLA